MSYSVPLCVLLCTTVCPTLCHCMSYSLPLCVVLCASVCPTLCHSLYHCLCNRLSHSLPLCSLLCAILCTTLCHYLSHSVPLFVPLCANFYTGVVIVKTAQLWKVYDLSSGDNDLFHECKLVVWSGTVFTSYWIIQSFWSRSTCGMSCGGGTETPSA